MEVSQTFDGLVFGRKEFEGIAVSIIPGGFHSALFPPRAWRPQARIDVLISCRTSRNSDVDAELPALHGSFNSRSLERVVNEQNQT